MQETRGGAARATTQTSEREVVRDAAQANVCAKAAYLSTIGLCSRDGAMTMKRRTRRPVRQRPI